MNDQSSCWIRVSSPWAGANYGGILLNRPEFQEALTVWEDRAKPMRTKVPCEVRERAVSTVREHEAESASLRAGIELISPQISSSPRTLLEWREDQEIEVVSGQLL